MGGNVSKTEAITKQVTEDMTKIQTDNIMETFVTRVSNQDLKVVFGPCTVKGVNIGQVDQFNLNVDAIQKASTTNEIDLEMTSKIKQKAEQTKQMFSLELASTDIVKTDSDSLTKAYTEIFTESRSTCFTNLTNTQNLDVEFSGGDSGQCLVEDVNVTQEMISDVVMNCTQDIVTNNDIIKKIISDIDQTATSTEENTIAGIIDSILSGLTAPLQMAVIAVGVIFVILIVMFLWPGSATSEATGSAIRSASKTE